MVFCFSGIFCCCCCCWRNLNGRRFVSWCMWCKSDERKMRRSKCVWNDGKTPCYTFCLQSNRTAILAGCEFCCCFLSFIFAFLSVCFSFVFPLFILLSLPLCVLFDCVFFALYFTWLGNVTYIIATSTIDTLLLLFPLPTLFPHTTFFEWHLHWDVCFYTILNCWS